MYIISEDLYTINLLLKGYNNTYWRTIEFGYHFPHLENARFSYKSEVLLVIINGQLYAPKSAQITKAIKTTQKVNCKKLMLEIEKEK